MTADDVGLFGWCLFVSALGWLAIRNLRRSWREFKEWQEQRRKNRRDD